MYYQFTTQKNTAHGGNLLIPPYTEKGRSLTHPRKTKAAAMFSQSRRAVSNAYFVRVKSSATWRLFFISRVAVMLIICLS